MQFWINHFKDLVLCLYFLMKIPDAGLQGIDFLGVN
jgi:hypothetical protein